MKDLQAKFEHGERQIATLSTRLHVSGFQMWFHIRYDFKSYNQEQILELIAF